MNYDAYLTFYELSKTKNFSKTAKRLNIVQSTVSNRIKELENHVGHPLFTRTNKSVELTMAGEQLLPFCKRLLAIEKMALSTLRSKRPMDQVRIGTVHSMYQGHIKQVIEKFIQNNTDVSVRVLFNHTDQLVTLFADDLIDVAIVSYLPKSKKFEKIQTLNDRIILVAKNDGGFQDNLKIKDLTTIPFLETDLIPQFDNWLSSRIGHALDSRLYIDQIHEVLNFVIRGLGYAFVPDSMAVPYIANGEIKQVRITDASPFKLENHIIVNPYRKNQHGLKTFIQALM